MLHERDSIARKASQNCILHTSSARPEKYMHIDHDTITQG
jgi:hypothetical protein